METIILNATMVGLVIGTGIIGFGLIRIIVVAIIDASNLKRMEKNLKKDMTEEHTSSFIAEVSAKTVKNFCDEPLTNTNTAFTYHAELKPDLVENFRKSWKETEEMDMEEPHEH